MRKHILIVENEADIREILQEFFEVEGYEVSTAEHGLEALKALENNVSPDLILLDLMMPVMCGAEFMTRRNLNPKWKDIPVIVMSASDKKRKDAMILGDHWEIQKPLLLEDLLDVVSKVEAHAK